MVFSRQHRWIHQWIKTRASPASSVADHHLSTKSSVWKHLERIPLHCGNRMDHHTRRWSSSIHAPPQVSLLSHEEDMANLWKDPYIPRRDAVWEPEEEVFYKLRRRYDGEMLTLKSLIKEDVSEARSLFQTTLQRKYATSLLMWNAWAVMEWKAGEIDTARKLFRKASKIGFDIYLWTSWATMERKEKNLIESERLYKIVLTSEPDHPVALMGYALLCHDLKRTDQARGYLQKLHQGHPQDLIILLTWAIFEGQNRNIDFARELFDKCLDDYSELNPYVWKARIDMERTLGQLGLAYQISMAALTRFPGSVLFTTTAAQLEFDRGNIQSSQDLMWDIITTKDAPAYVYSMLAHWQEILGRDGEAKTLYMDALDKFPSNVPCINALAALEARLGHLEIARKVYEIGLKESNHNPGLIERWGDLEQKYRQYEQAKDLYEQAQVQSSIGSSSNVHLILKIAALDARLGNVDKARTTLTKAMAWFPQDEQILLTSGRIELHEGQISAARKCYERAIQLDKSRGAPWNFRALVELKHHHPQRCKTIIDNALKYVPQDDHKSISILLQTYARACHALHQKDEAAKAMQKALTLAPKNWRIYVHLAKILHASVDDHSNSNSGEALPKERQEKQVLREVINKYEQALLYAPVHQRGNIEHQLHDVERTLKDLTFEES